MSVRLRARAVVWVPWVSESATIASFAFGNIIPKGTSMSTTFTTDLRRRRFADPSPERPSDSEKFASSASWKAMPLSTSASSMSWRARGSAAQRATVLPPSTRFISRPNSLSGCPATSTRFTGSSTSIVPPTRMIDTYVARTPPPKSSAVGPA